MRWNETVESEKKEPKREREGGEGIEKGISKGQERGERCGLAH